MPPFSCCPFLTVCCLHLCDFYGADSFVPLSRGEEQMKKCSFTSKGHIPGTFFLFLNKYCNEKVCFFFFFLIEQETILVSLSFVTQRLEKYN